MTLFPRRILIIDDNPALHEDYRKVLCPEHKPSARLSDLEKLVLGSQTTDAVNSDISFEVDSAHQGQDGLELVKKALSIRRPYSMAFVDMRMEPGWNGIETIRQLWLVSPDLQIVLCSAYSDYSWSEIVQTLGATDNLVILRKPFDNIEVLQLALALCKKWESAREVQSHLARLGNEVVVRTNQAAVATEMLKEETAARSQANERFSIAFHSMPLPMAMISVRALTWVDVNDAFCRLSGYSGDSLLGQSPDVMTLLQRQPQSLLDLLKQPGRVHEAEAEFNTPERGQLKVMLTREFFNFNHERHALIILQDVTEQRKSEERLRVGMRLEAIGRLSAGVAHDFNNIMTVVEGHTSILLNDRNLPPQFLGSLQRVADASRRASDVVSQLLSAQRRHVSTASLVDVADHVRHEVMMLRRLVGEHTEIRVDCSLGLPSIFIDPSNFAQILVNLVVNARDAMPNGGSVQICVRSVYFEPEDIVNKPGASAGQFIALHVADSGQRIDPAIRRTILEPRGPQFGVGAENALGLANVQSLVSQHGGWIDINSEESDGTCVSVYLPEARPETAGTPKHHPLTSTSSGAGRAALIVEDQESVRGVLRQMLAAIGFKVHEACTGMKALELWRRESSEISLVITDIMMPGGISGVELGRKLTEQKPGLRIIYTTGYDMDSVEGVNLKEGVNYLPKPYDVSTLAALVDKSFSSEAKTRTGPVSLPKAEPRQPLTSPLRTLLSQQAVNA